MPEPIVDRLVRIVECAPGPNRKRKPDPHDSLGAIERILRKTQQGEIDLSDIESIVRTGVSDVRMLKRTLTMRIKQSSKPKTENGSTLITIDRNTWDPDAWEIW